MPQLDRELLKEILSQPTAPFREGFVIRALENALDASGVPYFADPVGNIIVGASSKKEYSALIRKSNQEPLRIFIAHTDHPGFHGVEWKSPTELEIQWHGGSPVEHLQGAKLWLANRAGVLGEGQIVDFKINATGRAIDRATISVSADLRAKEEKAKDIFGGFGFRAPVWDEGNVIYTKAADDLVGCFCIVSLAKQLWSKSGKSRAKKVKPPFLGLLTRAEEVGYIGAIGHFELGWLKGAKREVLFVSLETSRTLPGAEIGKGPVIRLGDRTTVFDSGALQVFSGIAGKRMPGRFQRRIMDGGTCEATAATAYGQRAIGISVPLGNYHNQGFEGGPDCRGPNGPAPEFVHWDDVVGLVDLCHGLLQPGLQWKSPWKSKTTEFRSSLKKYQPLLRTSP